MRKRLLNGGRGDFPGDNEVVESYSAVVNGVETQTNGGLQRVIEQATCKSK